MTESNFPADYDQSSDPDTAMVPMIGAEEQPSRKHRVKRVQVEKKVGTLSVKVNQQALNRKGVDRILHELKNRDLAARVARYLISTNITDNDYARLTNECTELEERLGVKVKPRDYLFLSRVRKAMGEGTKLNLKQIALSSGYSVTESANPEVNIMRKIPPALMSEILGFSRGDVEREMVKVMKQDQDLAAKMRALELAGKMIGMLGEEKGVNINFNTGIKLGD